MLGVIPIYQNLGLRPTSPRFAKISEMKIISKSPLPIEIYTLCQNLSPDDYGSISHPSEKIHSPAKFNASTYEGWNSVGSKGLWFWVESEHKNIISTGHLPGAWKCAFNIPGRLNEFITTCLYGGETSRNQDLRKEEARKWRNQPEIAIRSNSWYK